MTESWRITFKKQAEGQKAKSCREGKVREVGASKGKKVEKQRPALFKTMEISKRHKD